jgi:hypothetical protein
MSPSNENTGEKETKTQVQKRKTSKLAITAVVLAVTAFFVSLPYVFAFEPSHTDILARNISGLPALAGLILGIVAILKIRKSRGTLKGLVNAIAGTVLAIMFLGIWLPSQILYDPLSPRRLSQTNLCDFTRAIAIYSNDHNGKYPAPDKWCDLLLEGDYVELDSFVRRRLTLYWPLVGGEMLVRPVPKRGRCDYAMNPNCEPNSPGYMILLFESKPGWNQVGGPELLTTEQWDGEGCNIAFNDSHVDFVRTEELGKLQWK